MADERYRLKGHFGSRAASNSTSACRDCGAVVDDTDAHDRWHDEHTLLREHPDFEFVENVAPVIEITGDDG